MTGLNAMNAIVLNMLKNMMNTGSSVYIKGTKTKFSV